MKLSIVTIGIFVGMLNQATKYLDNNIIKKDLSKYIPICSVVFGILLGVIGYFMPDVEMGTDLLEAIFIGASAGSASTGVHQIYKQHTKTTNIQTIIPEPEESPIDEDICHCDVNTEDDITE